MKPPKIHFELNVVTTKEAGAQAIFTFQSVHDRNLFLEDVFRNQEVTPVTRN